MRDLADRHKSLRTRCGHAARALQHPYLTLFSRISLGGLFIFAGAAKVGYFPEFIEEIEKYKILSGGLASAYGYILPPLEIILGALLLLGLFLRSSASLIILLTLSFLIAKLTGIARGLVIEDCGCLGPAFPLFTAQSLALDFAILALALQLIFHRGELLALGPRLKSLAGRFKQKPGEPNSADQ